jgi:hypothetical protein
MVSSHSTLSPTPAAARIGAILVAIRMREQRPQVMIVSTSRGIALPEAQLEQNDSALEATARRGFYSCTGIDVSRYLHVFEISSYSKIGRDPRASKDGIRRISVAYAMALNKFEEPKEPSARWMYLEELAKLKASFAVSDHPLIASHGVKLLYLTYRSSNFQMKLSPQDFANLDTLAQ